MLRLIIQSDEVVAFEPTGALIPHGVDRSPPNGGLWRLCGAAVRPKVSRTADMKLSRSARAKAVALIPPHFPTEKTGG